MAWGRRSPDRFLITITINLGLATGREPPLPATLSSHVVPQPLFFTAATSCKYNSFHLHSDSAVHAKCSAIGHKSQAGLSLVKTQPASLPAPSQPCRAASTTTCCRYRTCSCSTTTQLERDNPRQLTFMTRACSALHKTIY